MDSDVDIFIIAENASAFSYVTVINKVNIGSKPWKWSSTCFWKGKNILIMSKRISTKFQERNQGENQNFGAFRKITQKIGVAN